MSTAKSASKRGASLRRATPSSYHHGDLRNSLLQTAAQMLAEHGAEGLSLREISQHAGVSHTAAYRHYADKQALLADLAELGFRELLSLHDRSIAGHASPLERLAASGQAYVSFGRQHPQLLQLMFGGAIEPWDQHPGLVEAGRQLASALHSIVVEGQAAGELRPGDPQTLALAAWSQVHGLALLVAGRRVPGLDAAPGAVTGATRACIRLLIEGLKPSIDGRSSGPFAGSKRRSLR